MGRRNSKIKNTLILGIMMPILGIILITQLFLPLGFEIIFIMTLVSTTKIGDLVKETIT